MGLKLLASLKDVKVRSGSRKSVLSQLALAARDESPVTWLANTSIAELSEFNPKTIERALPDLLESGHISTLRFSGLANIHAVHPNGRWCIKPEGATVGAHLRKWQKGSPRTVEIVVGWLLTLDPANGGTVTDARYFQNGSPDTRKTSPRHNVLIPPTESLETPDTMSPDSKGTKKRKSSGARLLVEIIRGSPWRPEVARALRGGG